MLNSLVFIDSDMRRFTVCNIGGSSNQLNKCHIISKRAGHFSVIVLLMSGIPNSLPDYIVTSQNVACYKHRLAKQLILRCSAVFHLLF